VSVTAARIHPTAIVEDGVEIGAGTTVWDHVHVRRGAAIGRDCIVGEKSYIAYDVRIGDLVKINANVYVCADVTIGDGCLIAAHVVFTNDASPRATDPDITVLRPSTPDEHTAGARVGRGVSIGANATIGPGVELGDHCMIGMGAVVTRSVPPHGLVVGNPARLVGLVARDGRRVLTIEPGEELPRTGRIDCPGDGYLRLDGGSVVHHRD
jgi:acetyltransferase-like isoleucine patch superfamily enzyme